MGEPSSSWQNFNFRDDEGSAQGMQALRLLLAKLQEAQANPRLKPSVNNLLMTEDLMLTSTQRLPSSVAPMHLEGGEGVPVMHGPMQANVVPHPLQGPLQTDGAKKKQYHGQERHVGKIREEGDFHDDDDEPPSRSRHKKRTNERHTKRSRRNSSGGSSSSSQSGRSSHGRFPKKDSKDGLSPRQYFCNYRQSSSRMLVERAFGMLKVRFRTLLKGCDMLLQNVPKMVRTCLVLHNMCIDHGDSFDGVWVQEAQCELRRAQAEVAVTNLDPIVCSRLNDALTEVTSLLDSDPSQATVRAQNVGSVPIDATNVSGAQRCDDLSKVMFNERARRSKDDFRR
ncbi:hypothetical protein L7F22_037713 [Adiantum nelumboides]|nr:hypothetical protein [Adiantum nelumboides]